MFCIVNRIFFFFAVFLYSLEKGKKIIKEIGARV